MNVVVFGATSAIAQAASHFWAARGDRLLLVARNADNLNAVANDLRARYDVDIATHQADLADVAGVPDLVHSVFESMSQVDRVLIAYGTLPDQEACEIIPADAWPHLTTNFVSPVILVGELSRRMASHGGCIGVITSVAGERGRRSNYVYGSAKAGLMTFLQGMRHRLHGTKLHICDIRPGFIATPMTQHLKQGLLFAKPAKVAPRLVQAMDRGKSVVYLPGFWRWIMWVIRAMPTYIMHRTKL
ncbi:MAG: SDR family NAD(P)-dependent oxidoreductase [Acidobacteria bacterium]|nr:SDR family NAD(P)-dependent oxidoreductase [Acidobacteriota bacterium]